MPEFLTISEPSIRLLEGASLFLDLDGTLLEIAESPHAVQVGPDLVDLLKRLSEHLAGRIAIISGRSVADVRTLFPGLAITIGGSHGHELCWADGRRNSPVRPPALDVALDAMRALEARHPLLLVEDKPFGAALHFRRAPCLAGECRALAEGLAATFGLPLQTGKMVVEIKAAAANKGNALASFMADDLFRDGAPVFLGDDDNDEPAFAMARQRGGAGVLVGRPRETAAMWRLDSVKAAHAWLRNAIGAAS